MPNVESENSELRALKNWLSCLMDMWSDLVRHGIFIIVSFVPRNEQIFAKSSVGMSRIEFCEKMKSSIVIKFNFKIKLFYNSN